MQPTLSPKKFALAGKSIFTLVSKKTGARFTFKIRQPKDKPHFVSVLTGPNNEADYTFLGTIFEGRNFVHGKKSAITRDADSAKAFDWLWNKLALEDKTPDACEFHHEGKCCRCGRTLTVPSSIESGVGPECASKMGE